MRPDGPPRSPVTNSRSSSATPFSSSASRSRQQIFEAAAVRTHHPRQIEAAGRPARIFAVGVAREFHAHRLEIGDAVERVRKRFPHQQLIGDAVIAGDDLAGDAVDIVLGRRDDHPGIGECGMAGAAGHPGIGDRDLGAVRAVALRAQGGDHAAGAAADHQDVGLDQGSMQMRHFSLTCAHSPRPRAVLHRRMHVDDLLGTKNLAAEAGDAMLAKFDHRQELRSQRGRRAGLGAAPAPCGSRRPGRHRRRSRSSCTFQSRYFRSSCARFNASNCAPLWTVTPRSGSP